MTFPWECCLSTYRRFPALSLQFSESGFTSAGIWGEPTSPLGYFLCNGPPGFSVRPSTVGANHHVFDVMFAAARLLLLLTSLGGTTSLSLTGYGGAGYTGSAAAVSGVRTAKRAPAVYRAISTARLQQQTAAPPRVDRSEDGSSVRAPQYPYWYDPRIHNWGNIGAGGRFHATFAPLATAMIDQLSYGGFDVRKAVKQTLAANATVLDLCCGVGFSTAPGAVGIDTSPEMLSVAKLRRPDARFAFGNAESFGEDKSFDIVTLMVRPASTTHGRPRSSASATSCWPSPFTINLKRSPAPDCPCPCVSVRNARDACRWSSARAAQCDACGQEVGRGRRHTPRGPSEFAMAPKY